MFFFLKKRSIVQSFRFGYHQSKLICFDCSDNTPNDQKSNRFICFIFESHILTAATYQFVGISSQKFYNIRSVRRVKAPEEEVYWFTSNPSIEEVGVIMKEPLMMSHRTSSNSIFRQPSFHYFQVKINRFIIYLIFLLVAQSMRREWETLNSYTVFHNCLFLFKKFKKLVQACAC